MKLPEQLPPFDALHRRRLTLRVMTGALIVGAIAEVSGVNSVVHNFDVFGLSSLAFEGAFSALDAVKNRINPRQEQENPTPHA